MTLSSTFPDVVITVETVVVASSDSTVVLTTPSLDSALMFSLVVTFPVASVTSVFSDTRVPPSIFMVSVVFSVDDVTLSSASFTSSFSTMVVELEDSVFIVDDVVNPVTFPSASFFVVVDDSVVIVDPFSFLVDVVVSV